LWILFSQEGIVPSGNLHRGQLAEEVKFPGRATARGVCGMIRMDTHVD
jgi:hypothetical protein